MPYTIIDNLSVKNHGNKIRELILDSDCITIASPYLLPDFTDFINSLKWIPTKNLHLITTMVPNSEDQIKKAKSLNSLLKCAKTNGINLTISFNNSLHGKLYLFRMHGQFKNAIISSANMTENGMAILHEWGILISNEAAINKLHEDLIRSLNFHDVGHQDIITMAKVAKDYETNNKVRKSNKIKLKLINHISGLPSFKLNSANKFWLKPIGHSGEHIKSTRSFGQKKDWLHFSKKEPKDVSIGDILIAFAIGSGKILSVYRVESKVHFTSNNDRWPYYVEGENLTPKYGSNWFNNAITKESLKQHFEANFPGEKIKKGTQGYGAFQFGWDRLEVNSKFANFIIEKILEKESETV